MATGRACFAVAVIIATGLVGPTGAAHGQSCPGWRDPARTKIVGGDPATLAQWPSQAVLRLTQPAGKEAIFVCGGSAIAGDTVLTAAHCFDAITRSADGRYVSTAPRTKDWTLDLVLGVDALAKADPGHVYPVAEVTLHEGYRKRSAPLNGEDIALVRLKRRWPGAVATLSLEAATDPKTPPGAGLMVAGYGLLAGTAKGGGLTRFDRSDGSAYFAGSPTLQQVGVPLVETTDCAAQWPGKKVGAGQICAGFEKGEKDSCGGDSGGPLIVYDQQGCPTHVGLVSWGAIDCASPKAYGVYTRLSYHAAWLRKHVPGVLAKSAAAPGQGATDLSPSDFVHQATELMGSSRAAVKIGVRGDNKVKVGKDYVFEVTSDVQGRLIIIDVNADGVATQIFPNEHVLSKEQSLVRPKETVTVPGPGYGFDVFRAEPPLGKGLLIALVVPEDFPVDLLIGAPERRKGFKPERSAVGYFMNLLHQIAAKAASARDAGAAQQPVWAIYSTEYEIVP